MGLVGGGCSHEFASSSDFALLITSEANHLHWYVNRVCRFHEFELEISSSS